MSNQIRFKQITVPDAAIPLAKLAETVLFSSAGAIAAGANRITGLANAVADSDAATLADVKAVAAGLGDPKDSVRFLIDRGDLAAYTRVANVITANANGALGDHDGITPAVGNRVLLWSDAAHADAGIYVVTEVGGAGDPFVLTRSSDADTSEEVTSGLGVWIIKGTEHAGSFALLQTADPITLNTTALDFNLIPLGGATVVAGNGLADAGGTFSVDAEDDSIAVGVDGVRAAIMVVDDRNLIPDVTANDGDTTGLVLFRKPADGALVSVFVNGVLYDSSALTSPCYFSDDAGTTAVNPGENVQDDELFWNGSIAGFNLDGTDRVRFLYEATAENVV